MKELENFELENLDFENLVLKKTDTSVINQAKKHWDSIAKPLGSLGQLEELVIQLAGIFGTEDVHIDRRCALIACADNGVVAEGVTQSDSAVTASVAREIAAGKSNINIMGAAANVDVYAVDVGMLHDVDCEGIIRRKVARGTGNIAKEPAMSREQALQAVQTGISLVGEMKDRGYQLIVTGEMGIGNTTTSSALAAVLLEKSAAEVTGRGAGLTIQGLRRKIETVEKAIAVNHATVQDEPLLLLAKLGGFDIAAMTGMFLGGAVYGLPVLIDGIISSVAALLAYRLVPACREFMIATHITEEPAGKAVLALLGLKPVIHAGLYLGEGTGAVCMLPLLDIALHEYRYAHRFAQTDIAQYERLT